MKHVFKILLFPYSLHFFLSFTFSLFPSLFLIFLSLSLSLLSLFSLFSFSLLTPVWIALPVRLRFYHLHWQLDSSLSLSISKTLRFNIIKRFNNASCSPPFIPQCRGNSSLIISRKLYLFHLHYMHSDSCSIFKCRLTYFHDIL